MHRDDPLRSGYRTRILGSLVLSLALVLAALHLWPESVVDATPRTFGQADRDVIALDEVQPTGQPRHAPPPPRPLVPVPVPDNVVLEDVDLDLTDPIPVADVTDPESDADALPGEDAIQQASAPAPDQEARAVRFVVPTYTDAAKNRSIRAAITVEVDVDHRGRVQEARIVDRFLLDEKNQPVERIEHLGYGLEQAALAAAQRWLFRPARDAGQNVASTTTITLRFDDG